MLTFIARGKQSAIQKIRSLGELSAAINKEAQSRENEFYYRDAYTVSSCITYIRMLAQANMVWNGLSTSDATSAFLSTANPSALPKVEASYQEIHRKPAPPCRDMRGVLGMTDEVEGGPASVTPETRNVPRSVLLERIVHLYAFQKALSDLEETYNFPYISEIIGYVEEHIKFFLVEGKISREEMMDAYEDIRHNIPFGSYNDFECVLRSEVKAMQKYGDIFWSEAMQMMGFGRMKGVIVPVEDKRGQEILKALIDAHNKTPRTIS